MILQKEQEKAGLDQQINKKTCKLFKIVVKERYPKIFFKGEQHGQQDFY